jgi:hypothetical protein
VDARRGEGIFIGRVERESEVLDHPVVSFDDLEFPDNMLTSRRRVVLVDMLGFFARCGFPSHDNDRSLSVLGGNGFLDLFGRYDLNFAGRARSPISWYFGLFIDEDRRGQGLAHGKCYLAQLTREIPGQRANEPPLGRDEEHDQASEEQE